MRDVVKPKMKPILELSKDRVKNSNSFNHLIEMNIKTHRFHKIEINVKNDNNLDDLSNSSKKSIENEKDKKIKVKNRGLNIDTNEKDNDHQSKIKHSYQILNKHKIQCVKCGNILENASLHYSRIESKESELIELLENKEKNGIVGLIYKISLRKDANGIYLHFPGKHYVGLTTNAMEKEWIDKLSRAFNERSPDRRTEDKFSRALRKYSYNDKDIARKLFKIEIWQVCFSQEELDESEKYWIGFFKTQQDKFGFNTLEGGRINPPQETGEKSPYWKDIPFEVLDKAIEESFKINPIDGPLAQLSDQFGVDETTLISKIAYYYKDENGKALTYTDLRYQYIKQKLEKLMKKGFKSSYVGEKLGKQFNISESNWPNIANEWCKSIYGKTYSEVRDKFLNEEIESIVFSALIRGNNISYENINKKIPGLEIRAIQRKIDNVFGGLKNLKKNLRRPLVLALALHNISGKDLCRIIGYSDKRSPNPEIFRNLLWGLSLAEFKNLTNGIIIECKFCRNRQTFTMKNSKQPPKIPQARCTKCGKSIYPKL